MNMIVDIVLLAVSGAAVFYCAVLHQRLGDLMDAKKGIGAGIASMSAALDETRSVLQSAQESCKRSIAELAPMLSESRECCAKLADLTDVASEMADLATDDMEKAADAALERIAAAAAPPARRARSDAFRRPISREAVEALRALGGAQLLG